MTKLVRGFQEFYHHDAWKRNAIVNKLNLLAKKHDFKLLHLPTVEFAETFQKAVGISSNIVQKEFFYCHNLEEINTKMVLRPELTSGTMRHFLDHKKINRHLVHNVFSYGSCFRYEKPQRGRYREFYQWNVEQINFHPRNLGQVLSLLKNILLSLDLIDQVVIELNYLSSEQFDVLEQKIYQYQKQFPFCDTCQKRFQTKKVQRILDCHNCHQFLANVINLEDYLTSNQRAQYDQDYQNFQFFFPNTQIVKKTSLTRGLDYYSGLVFEIKFLDASWSKDVLIAGGSYRLQAFDATLDADLLGFGFAIGIDRLILVLNQIDSPVFANLKQQVDPTIMIGVLNEQFFPFAYNLQERLSKQDLIAKVYAKTASFNHLITKSLKQQMQYLLVFGKEFQQNQKIILRLLSDNPNQIWQKTYSFVEVINFFSGKQSNSNE